MEPANYAFISGKTEQEYLVLNKNQFEAFIKHFLLVLHYRIEVYSSKGGQKSNDWFLEFKGSPGNLDQFENIFVDSGLVTGRSCNEENYVYDYLL